MMEKVISLLKNKTLSIPEFLLKSYKKLGLTDQEFIVLIVLINSDEIYNPTVISQNLNIELYELLSIVSSITTKGLMSIETKQVLKAREEYLSFELLYQKLAFLVINEEEANEKPTNLFDIFEKEFGRTLSSIEYELISAWLNGEFSEEIIVLALKEAVYNGVSNLRYIDKILYEWKKKGIKTKEDVEKDRESFKKNKKNTTELYDYDWLNDDE